MARTPNENHRKVKESKILESARLVFCRKGYLDVTLQDIIDECGISRGGIYLYFNSVSEIFREVAASRNKERFSEIRRSVDSNAPYIFVFENFLNLQKQRLLHMENSILRAMYEFIFSRAEGATREFRDTQLDNLRRSVMSILSLGVNQGYVSEQKLRDLTDHIVIVIEGLGVLALSEVLTAEIIDAQFSIIKVLANSCRMPVKN